MKIIIDIPGTNKLSGGTQRMLELYDVLKKADHEVFLHLYLDNFIDKYDLIITFSDNPQIIKLCDDAKSKNAKVIVYQLSYGMCLEWERVVVNHPDTIICCSTKHIKNKIIKDNCKKNIYYIGHSQELTIDNFYPEDTFHNYRNFDVAIMIHKSQNKIFFDAFEYCKSKKMKIVLFGGRNNNFNLSGAERIFLNADVDRIRWIFSNSKKYLNLSICEGLNKPGIEAMLCGCKPYIVDGCELYKNNENCKFIKKPEEIYENFKICDYNTIRDYLKKFTWKKVLKKLSIILEKEL